MARRTKLEAEQTRHAILDAAERIFYAHGVTRTSLEEIAKHAGVTRGAVYWHFKDKIELCEAMLQRDAFQGVARIGSSRMIEPGGPFSISAAVA